MANCFSFLNQGGMGWMMLLGLFWIVLVVVVVYLLMKLLTNRKDETGIGSGKETPLEILQKEFAKGNITEEEYLKRKKYLE